MPPRLLDEVISVTRASLPGSDVVNKLAENSVLGTVLATGLRAVIAEPRISHDALRSAFESAGRAAVHRMERYLNTLGTIASAAPLLGLMGTVIGMIEIFGSQAPTGGSNPTLLAHGISVALYNTAFGLMIAIPSLMFYRYFRGLVGNHTDFRAEVFFSLCAQVLARTSASQLGEILSETNAGQFPELVQPPSREYRELLAAAELAKLQRALLQSRWVAFGRLLGCGDAAGGRDEMDAEARLAALRKSLRKSRWMRLGSELGCLPRGLTDPGKS